MPTQHILIQTQLVTHAAPSSLVASHVSPPLPTCQPFPSIFKPSPLNPKISINLRHPRCPLSIVTMSDTDRDRAQRLLTKKTPSSSQALAVAALFPLGGILLTLSGLTLTGTVIGLTVAFPLFVIFSPVLVPAAMLVGLVLSGFFASGAMGVTAVRALSLVGRVLGRVFSRESIKMVRRRMAEAAGARTKDVGRATQSRAHEYGRT